MLQVILVLIVILWLLGYVNLPSFNIPDIILFRINGQAIDLSEFLIFLLIVWASGILPSPFRQIAFAGVVLWVLALFNIIAVSGLSTIILLAMVIGIIAYLLTGHKG